MLIKYVWFQNNSGQVNICVCNSYSLYSNAHTTPVRIYDEPYAHKFCAADIFWIITRRQVISPVSKFYHVLGRGFMIQRMILILIKCLSANQNKLFYIKYNICYYICKTCRMGSKSIPDTTYLDVVIL